MTDVKPPVSIHELIQLSHIGIPGDQVTWSRVTMTSDRWIAVRHNNRDDKESMVTVLNPKDGVISYAGQTSADSIQMNPTQPIIALKAGARIEVFNFDTKVMISKTKIHEPVVYWTWLNSDIIAMVTETLVYHWDLWQADGPPEPVFNRHQRLSFSEIISYKADPSLKWLAVTGLTPEEKKISGITQLYSVNDDITQCISAHAVCFSTYHYDDNPSPSTVMCVASREIHDHGKVHVIELGPYKQGNFAPRNNYDHIRYLDDADHYDFPISLHVSCKYGLLFVMTKYGYLYLCDMETAACLCCTRVSLNVIFTSTLNTDTQGIVGVTRAGQIVTVDIKKDGFIKYVRDTAKKTNQANRLEKAISVQLDNNGGIHVPQKTATSTAPRPRESSSHALRDPNSNTLH